MGRTALPGLWSWEPRMTQSMGLATACRAGRWCRALLADPDEASDKPGPTATPGQEPTALGWAEAWAWAISRGSKA